MKHGKNPTVKQKKQLQAVRLNPDNWLISKDTPEVMVVIHRVTEEVNTIRKEWLE